jgi:tetratricopeptide (TPR) repeat protein
VPPTLLKLPLALFLLTCAATSPSLAAAPDFNSLMGMGQKLAQHNHYPEALRCFQQARQIAPNRWEPYWEIGDAELTNDDCKAAVETLTRGIELNSKSGDLYFTRGKCYQNLGELNLAVADLTRAIALEPKNAHFYERRAFSYAALGEYKKALADYNKAIELDAPIKASKGVAARAPYKEYYVCLADRARIDARLGNYQKAIDDFTAALTAPPTQSANSMRILYERADCYDKLGKHDLASKDRTAATNHKGDILEDLVHDPTLGTGK